MNYLLPFTSVILQLAEDIITSSSLNPADFIVTVLKNNKFKKPLKVYKKFTHVSKKPLKSMKSSAYKTDSFAENHKIVHK